MEDRFWLKLLTLPLGTLAFLWYALAQLLGLGDA